MEHQLGVVLGVDFDERLLGNGDVVDILVPRRNVERPRQPENTVTVDVNDVFASGLT